MDGQRGVLFSSEGNPFGDTKASSEAWVAEVGWSTTSPLLAIGARVEEDLPEFFIGTRSPGIPEVEVVGFSLHKLYNMLSTTKERERER